NGFDLRGFWFDEINHTLVASVCEAVLGVEHVGDAAAHTRSKVLACWSQYKRDAARHVFTAMFAYTLHDGGSATVPHAKPFTSSPVEECTPGRRAVQHNIAGDDVLFRHVCRINRWAYRDSASGQAFAHVVVRVAVESKLDPWSEKRAEALTRGSVEVDANRVLR